MFLCKVWELNKNVSKIYVKIGKLTLYRNRFMEKCAENAKKACNTTEMMVKYNRASLTHQRKPLGRIPTPDQTDRIPSEIPSTDSFAPWLIPFSLGGCHWVLHGNWLLFLQLGGDKGHFAYMRGIYKLCNS
jgi:hypothetical protein